MLYGNINPSNQSNYQSRRPDSVNVSHPSAKLMPSRNDTLIMNIAIYDIEKKNQHHLYPFSVNHASFEIKVGLYTNFERIKKVCRQEKININPSKTYLIARLIVIAEKLKNMNSI